MLGAIPDAVWVKCQTFQWPACASKIDDITIQIRFPEGNNRILAMPNRTDTPTCLCIVCHQNCDISHNEKIENYR